ncbi:hypothetical protein [Neisseria viridiae]|nr:hypothetical protein [Neisseria viridiae]
MPSERRLGVIGESAAASLSEPPKDGQSPDKVRRRGRIVWCGRAVSV